MNLRYRYPTITYADLVASMGLTETPIISAPAPGPQWPFQAFITMGNRCHGDAISPDFAAVVKSVNANWATPGTNGYHLLNDQWARAMPWAGIVAGANNRCTNAAVMVYDTQMQYFSISQQKWILISFLADRIRNWTSSYYTSNYTTTDGTADILYKTRFNAPAFCPVKQLADRSAEDTNGNGSIYRILHSGLTTGVVHPDFNISDIGGIFVSCAMRIVSADGNPLNSASVEIMGQVGADYYPQADKMQNDGYLTGIYSTPAVGTGSFKLIPPDGSEKRLYFVSADINPNTFIQSSSAYVLANGPKSQCMSAATLQANIPQLMIF